MKNKNVTSRHSERFLIIISSLILIFFVFIYFLILNYYEGSKKEALENYGRMLKNEYVGTTVNYQSLADLVYTTSINTNEIRALYARCLSAEDEEASTIFREELYNSLADIYSLLGEYNFRQLHFHDAGNHSYLRFHRPEKFGDDLTGIRFSVEFVNREKKKIAGFEEGRIFNGYRFVYPMSYEGQHIGSVEVSVSMKTIIEHIEKTLGQEAQFVLLRSQMEKKVFDTEIDNYIAWPVDERFVMDKDISAQCILEEEISEKDGAKIRNLTEDKLGDGEPFAIEIKLDGENKILTFLPVHNFLDQNIAYLMSASAENRLDGIRGSFRVITAIYLFFLLMIIFLAWFYYVTKKKIDSMMKTDQLTNIDTRRILLEKIDSENSRFCRYKRPYSIIMIDIDHFKRINDTYGHLAGDDVLKQLAEVIKNNIRTADTFGRYGGEEFIVMLPETCLPDAACVAENLRKAVEETVSINSEKITISLGVAEVFVEAKDIDELIEVADRNLYKAKETGRNKVCY